MGSCLQKKYTSWWELEQELSKGLVNVVKDSQKPLQNHLMTKDDIGKAWVSRSVAVCCIVYHIIDGQYHFLVTKRGDKCPNNVGYWCFPCGYLDYNEDLKQAVSRELFEETDITIPPKSFSFFTILDDPTDSNQNITVVFFHELLDLSDIYDYLQKFEDTEQVYEHSKGEVEDIRLMSIRDMKDWQFAFGHYELALEFISNKHAY